MLCYTPPPHFEQRGHAFTGAALAHLCMTVSDSARNGCKQ